MDMTEQQIREYALHLGLLVRRRGNMLELSERGVGRRIKAKVGTYRSWHAVKLAIEQYGAEQLRKSTA